MFLKLKIRRGIDGQEIYLKVKGNFGSREETEVEGFYVFSHIR